jgi:hypothetical protein
MSAVTALRKIGVARKASAEAIAAVVPREAKAATLVPPDDYGLTRDELIAQFAQFPREQQLELLTKKWDLVRGPDMIPPLRRAIECQEELSTLLKPEFFTLPRQQEIRAGAWRRRRDMIWLHGHDSDHTDRSNSPWRRRRLLLRWTSSGRWHWRASSLSPNTLVFFR